MVASKREKDAKVAAVDLANTTGNVTPFRRIESGGEELEERVNKLQTQLEQALESLPGAIIIDGQHIENVSLLGASNTRVLHKLGRVPRGWFLTRKTVGGNVPSEVSKSGVDLVLLASTAETVDLWVF